MVIVPENALHTLPGHSGGDFFYERGNGMNQFLPAEQAIQPDFSTTETVRHRLEELKALEPEFADTPVILVVPIGGDTSEFE